MPSSGPGTKGERCLRVGCCLGSVSTSGLCSSRGPKVSLLSVCLHSGLSRSSLLFTSLPFSDAQRPPYTNPVCCRGRSRCYIERLLYVHCVLVTSFVLLAYMDFRTQPVDVCVSTSVCMNDVWGQEMETLQRANDWLEVESAQFNQPGSVFDFRQLRPESKQTETDTSRAQDVGPRIYTPLHTYHLRAYMCKRTRTHLSTSYYRVTFSRSGNLKICPPVFLQMLQRSFLIVSP